MDSQSLVTSLDRYGEVSVSVELEKPYIPKKLTE